MTDKTPEQKRIEEEVAERLREELRAELEDEIKSKFTADNKETMDALIAENLSKMKSNVDKAYGKVDELTAELTRLRELEKENKKRRMEEEGQHLELSKMQVTELTEKLKMKEEMITSLTRDQQVKDLLSGQPFKNEKARTFAFDTIVKELVNDEDRGWIHRSGATMKDYFATFVKDPDYSDILFKSKDNTGTGTPTSTRKGTPSKPLKEMTTQEMLEAAARGEFGESSLF